MEGLSGNPQKAKVGAGCRTLRANFWYKTAWGKMSLPDAGWGEVEPGKEADYNFFKVTVEMK